MFPCYAPPDRLLAEECAGLLERDGGFKVFLDDGQLRPGEDVVSKAADALSADVMLIFLSPDASPARWDRKLWESAFLSAPKEAGAHAGFVLCNECQYPPLLRREKWFDATVNPRTAFRAVKRWLRGLDRLPVDTSPPARGLASEDEEEFQRLCEALADAPGVAESKYPPAEFVRRCQQDFDALFFLFLKGCTLAEAAGHLGSQLGMRLEGEAADNLRRVRDVCAGQRCLLVVYGAEDAEWIPGGLSSVLFTSIDQADHVSSATSGPEQRLLDAVSACGPGPVHGGFAALLAGVDEREAIDGLVTRGLVVAVDPHRGFYCAPSSEQPKRDYTEAICRAFAGWAKDPALFEAALPQLRRTLQNILEECESDERWRLGIDLARCGISITKRAGRLAETSEILEQALEAATARDDHAALAELSRERIWILEAWGREVEAMQIVPRLEFYDNGQMSFEF